jgi:hypothetical protein
VCEATKAAQNAAYSANAAATKLDCERLKAQSHAACEAAATTARTKCETAKKADIDAAQPLIAKYDSLKKLATPLRAFHVEPGLQEYVFSKLPSQHRAELKFYKFLDSGSLYNKLLIAWSPSAYAAANQVPDVAILHKTTFQSIGTETFIDSRYRLTAQDVVRVAVIAVFFAELGSDGVAQLQKSGTFDLGNSADVITLRTCSAILADKKYSCDLDVTLTN